MTPHKLEQKALCCRDEMRKYFNKIQFVDDARDEVLEIILRHFTPDAEEVSYTGNIHCHKCGQLHWIDAECPQPQPIDKTLDEVAEKADTDCHGHSAKAGRVRVIKSALLEYSELIRKDWEEANQTINAQCNAMLNIADTCRSRNFTGPTPLDERVIAMAQQNDSLKQRVKQLESERKQHE